MSLIFLKNSDNSETNNPTNQYQNAHLLPYRWSNYFTQPLKLPRNAQICYISSIFKVTNTDNMGESFTYYIRTGRKELNPVITYHTDSYNEGWVTECNYIARNINQYSSDNTYNHTESIFDYEVDTEENRFFFTGIVATLKVNGGWNLVLGNTYKPKMTITPRPVLDIDNQGFNDGITIDATGIDDDMDDILCYAVASPLYQGKALNGNYIDGVFYPANTAGSHIPLGATTENWTANNNVSAPPAFGTFYDNGGGAWGIVGQSAPALVPPGGVYGFGISPANRESRPDYNWGYWSMVYTNTGLKQYTSIFTPTTVNSHALIGNGYLIKRFPVVASQIQANIDYPIPPPADPPDYPNPGNMGFSGIPNCSFGIQSVSLIEDAMEFGVADYVRYVDLNHSQDPTKAVGGLCRFIIGVDIETKNHTQTAYVRCLRANGEDGTYSSYQNSYYGGNLGTNDYVAKLDIGLASTNLPPGVAGVSNISFNTYNTTPGRIPYTLSFRFRMSSPYTIAVEYTYRYRFDRDTPDVAGGVTNDPTTDWVLLYDMRKDPATAPMRLIPGFCGDLTLVEYEYMDRSKTNRRGFFDVRQSYRRDVNIIGGINNADKFLKFPFLKPYYPTSMLDKSTYVIENGGFTSLEMMEADGTTPITPEIFDPTTKAPQKEIIFIANPCVKQEERNAITNADNVPLFQMNQPLTHLGETLGFRPIKANMEVNDTVPPATQYSFYETDATAEITLPQAVWSNHIQINNLPIQSQNGVRSTMNKTIAVVDTLCNEINSTQIGTNTIYCNTASMENWIDINNYQEIDLQKIDVLITNDDNTEANHLIGKTNIVVKIRQKPANQSNLYLPDNIQTPLKVDYDNLQKTNI